MREYEGMFYVQRNGAIKRTSVVNVEFMFELLRLVPRRTGKYNGKQVALNGRILGAEYIEEVRGMIQAEFGVQISSAMILRTAREVSAGLERGTI